ncbi:MAG: hypothetical protein ACOCVG_05570, partial [Verrucomicrobiota bacterium]
MEWRLQERLGLAARALFNAFQEAFNRFPLVLFAALWMTIGWSRMVEADFTDTPWSAQTFFTGILGVPWLLAAALFRERSVWRRPLRFLPELPVIAGLVLFAALSPRVVDEAGSSFALRWFVLLVAGHCAIAVAPFVADSRQMNIWRFNVAILLRTILGGIFAVALFLGLAGALFSFDELFLGGNTFDSAYGILWGCCMGLFQTLYILGGFPRDGSEADLPWLKRYPPVLRFPSQFVLTPLALVFLSI